jgi:KaiC/GvpD/RAD55 family RecA-like ATPase
VNDWNQAFLGVIAVSTALMAILQIGAIVVLARVATQVKNIVGTLNQDIRPLIARANVIADEAARTATLATAQAQKIDRMVTDLARRVDETSAVVQQAIIAPAREGMAIIAALKAGLGALKGFKDYRGRPGRMDDEDPLFIG